MILTPIDSLFCGRNTVSLVHNNTSTVWLRCCVRDANTILCLLYRCKNRLIKKKFAPRQEFIKENMRRMQHSAQQRVCALQRAATVESGRKGVWALVPGAIHPPSPLRGHKPLKSGALLALPRDFPWFQGVAAARSRGNAGKCLSNEQASSASTWQNPVFSSGGEGRVDGAPVRVGRLHEVQVSTDSDKNKAAGVPNRSGWD